MGALKELDARVPHEIAKVALDKIDETKIKLRKQLKDIDAQYQKRLNVIEQNVNIVQHKIKKRLK